MPERPTKAFIDLDAVAHNVGIVRKIVGPSVRIMAVVKADGYGHGAYPVAAVALKAGADWLGVANPTEGIALRERGLQTPIFVLGQTTKEELPKVLNYRFSQMVADADSIRRLAALAKKQRCRVGVHLKVDTGMGRLGAQPEKALPLAQRIMASPSLVLEGLMSHLAAADSEDQSHTQGQIKAFARILSLLKKHGIDPPLKHVANSAAVLTLPDSHFTLVRPGIMIYGLSPANNRPRSWGLRPALRLVTKVIFLKTVGAGTHISYGCTYTTKKRTRIATLPIGYADGYSRLLSSRGQVLIGGQRAPIVGRVCMDMLMVDVSHISGVKEGEEAVLYGCQGQEEITVEEVARLAQTVNYEIICSLGKRVPKFYTWNGVVFSEGESFLV